MTETVYINARGETVVPYHVFKELSFEAIVKSAGKPYPKPRRTSKKHKRGRTFKRP